MANASVCGSWQRSEEACIGGQRLADAAGKKLAEAGKGWQRLSELAEIHKEAVGGWQRSAGAGRCWQRLGMCCQRPDGVKGEGGVGKLLPTLASFCQALPAFPLPVATSL